MTAFELNAEIYKQLSIIATDENLMQRALKAIKRIAASKINDDTDKTTIMLGIESGINDVAKGNVRAFDDFLNAISNEK